MHFEKHQADRGLRELLADSATAKLGELNVYTLEGYIATWAYSEALRKAGKEPTRARLRKALDGLQEMNPGGFRVTLMAAGWAPSWWN